METARGSSKGRKGGGRGSGDRREDDRERRDEPQEREKINNVRAKAKKWGGLCRTGYFGRNLIVQAMYFGRMRYWLYSINMTKKLVNIVQKDADILW